MAEIRAAYRYALALLEAAESAKTAKAVETVGRDFAMLEALFASSREFLLFLRSPVVNTQRKKAILTSLFKNTVSEITFRFILLLTTKHRETILPEIIRQFYILRDERLGIKNVMVRSAVELTKEQERKLAERLEQATGKKVHLHRVIEKELKGGVAVQIDDTVWDGSVKRQLELLSELFRAVHV